MMNPTNCDTLKFTLSAREIKKRFCKIYENVILNYFTFNEGLISGAKVILNSHKGRKKFKADLSSYQLAFLLSFGVQDTCTVARKFYESIKNHTEVIKKLSENNPIKLLCIESESLPAVIGVCQVINEIVKEFGSAGKCGFRDIRISIIDNRKKWRRLCAYIIDMVNSYFTNIELKLDFVEDFISWSAQEFIDIIKELDLMIIARFFAEDRCFTENYNLMMIVLKEMKEDSVLFYFDSCNERYYANLKKLISKTSFYEVKSCENLHVLFEDLGDKEYYLDLPVSWDTDIQSVMFSTWIKAADQEASFPDVAKPIASNQLSPIKPTVKSNDKETLNGHIFHSEIAKTSTSGETNIVNDKKKVKSSVCNKYDIPTKQGNLVNTKKKIKSSKKPCNQIDSPCAQTNIVSSKEKVMASIKNCSSYTATTGTGKTGVSKVGNESHGQKTHEMLSNLLSILNEQTADSRTAKSSQRSQCSNVSRDAAISQKVIGKAEIKSVKELGCESSAFFTTQTIQPKRNAKAAVSIISTSSTSKMISTNQEHQTVLPKNGQLKASMSLKKSEAKSSERSTRTETNSESTASKEEFKTKSINKKSSTTPEVQSETAVPVNLPKKSSNKNATLTKKSSKNNATEKVKLTGKFAHMDLEKRNKDERHKMRAKKASFAKFADFDYDD